MPVVVFYLRSVGERCSSIRYRLQTRRDGPVYDRFSEGSETADPKSAKPFLTPSAMPNKSKPSGCGRYADMTDDLKNTTATEAVAEDWAKVKLPLRLTGLPMAVSITENDGYPHDVGQSQHSSWRSRRLAHPQASGAT